MELKEKLCAIMRREIEDCGVAGASLLVEKDGREVCFAAGGMADIGRDKPMERGTIFRLYSQTKPITAAAAMILMERGEIDLCQPVSDFIPAFRKQRVLKDGSLYAPVREMNVSDLLRMTSGLVYPDESTEAGRRTGEIYSQIEKRRGSGHEMTTQEVAEALAECPLLFDPGSSFQYGTSADVLGAVIETASKMSLAAFLKKEIFDPLHMTDTGFWVPEEKRGRMASAYETVTLPDGQKTLSLYTGNNLSILNAMDVEPAFASGGAGLASTLDDYMKFARMLLNGGELSGRRVLSPATVRYMTGGQLMSGPQRAFDMWNGLEGYSYGCLMRVCKNPSQACLLSGEGEYGWDGWLGMHFANLPGERMTILAGVQKKDAGTFRLTRKLRNVIISSLVYGGDNSSAEG